MMTLRQAVCSHLLRISRRIRYRTSSTIAGTTCNNNNNFKTMFTVLSSWQSHCESSPGSFDECRTAPSGRRPKTKPDDLGSESASTGCQSLHPPSPFIITQSTSWYSFYCPTEGRRLSRPSWLVTRPQMVTHPGTNRVWRSATTLIEANTLPLSQTANRHCWPASCVSNRETASLVYTMQNVLTAK